MRFTLRLSFHFNPANFDLIPILIRLNLSN